MSSPGSPPDPLPSDVRARFVSPSGPAFERLVEVMARLRAPDGCPWDLEQTHRSLARHLLEETYEVLETIDSGDSGAMREELGDLLLQVIFHSHISFTDGGFTISQVCDQLREKLVRRHPHVFGDLELTEPDEVLANWERIKRAEKGSGVMDGIPSALPALARVAKLSKRAEQVGFAWPNTESVLAKLDEEIGELHEELVAEDADAERLEGEIGDVLWVLAVLARRLHIEPESALRRAAARFEARFRSMESQAAASGRPLESLSADEWSEYWERAKTETHTR